MTIRRLAQALGLCGVALLGVLTIIASNGGNPPSGAPSIPALLGVLDGTCAEIPPGTAGGFRLLPRQGVRLRVAAPWPSADLVVTANGTDLEKVGSSDTGRQIALRAAGTGYWVPEDIDPNPSPPAWTLEVQLPPPMRQGPLTLTVSSRQGGQSSSPLTVNVVNDMNATATAPNRVDLNWRDRGDEGGYLLQRRVSGGPYIPLVSIGMDATSYTDTSTTGNRQYSYRLTAQLCGPSVPPGAPRTGSSISQVDVTTPKETGVDEITLSRSTDPGDDQFVYKNSLLLFMPEDALVSSITNISTDVNSNGVKLELVRHTDANGVSRSLPAANCPTAPLEPQASTATFDGLTVQGEWKVRAVCISQTLLSNPPARIALRIAWTQ
jgi:hypothetical protein